MKFCDALSTNITLNTLNLSGCHSELCFQLKITSFNNSLGTDIVNCDASYQVQTASEMKKLACCVKH